MGCDSFWQQLFDQGPHTRNHTSSKGRRRKHLNVDALLATMRSGFEIVQDNRPGKVQNTLADVIKAGFAMIILKDPSLLAFGE